MAINMNLAMQLYSQMSKMLKKDFMPTCKVIKDNFTQQTEKLKKTLLFKKQ